MWDWDCAFRRGETVEPSGDSVHGASLRVRGRGCSVNTGVRATTAAGGIASAATCHCFRTRYGARAGLHFRSTPMRLPMVLLPFGTVDRICTLCIVVESSSPRRNSVGRSSRHASTRRGSRKYARICPRRLPKHHEMASDRCSAWRFRFPACECGEKMPLAPSAVMFETLIGAAFSIHRWWRAAFGLSCFPFRGGSGAERCSSRKTAAGQTRTTILGAF